MRSLLIILMMALAPLRGWAGDVMAISMAMAPALAGAHAGSGLSPVATNGSAREDAEVSAHAGCLGHGAIEVAGVPHPDASREGVASSVCPACSLCQVCSSPGLAITVNLTSAVRFAHVVPLPGSIHFTSAERASGFKPPIL